MKKIIVTTGIVCIMCLASASSFAQGKTGYIDLNELISIMPSAKKADSVLNDYRQALAQSAQDKQNELQAAYDKFIQDSAKMTPAVKEVKRKELQDRIQENSGLEQKLNEQFEQKRQELGAPVQKEALDAVNAVAKENGYTFVFYKEAVIIAPPADNLLELVKKKLKIK